LKFIVGRIIPHDFKRLFKALGVESGTFFVVHKSSFSSKKRTCSLLLLHFPLTHKPRFFIHAIGETMPKCLICLVSCIVFSFRLVAWFKITNGVVRKEGTSSEMPLHTPRPIINYDALRRENNFS
jgi:hypothetical protein